VLRGVSAYAQEHGYWSFYFQPRALEMPIPGWLARWEGDGIIARIANEKMANVLARTKLPVVDLRNSVRGTRYPAVGPDNREVARLGAEHFLERGFRHFAFCGMPRGEYRFMDQRHDWFTTFLDEAGCRCATFALSLDHHGAKAWDRQQNRLAAWLDRLPKPLAVMAFNDEFGVHVLDACQRAGLAVPEQVAVLGSGNDETLCTLCTPPLSSIHLDVERIGYAAAALLDRLISGQPPPSETLERPPREIIVRRSTDVLATDDREFAAALRFLRDHACEGIRVRDVVNHALISRSSLERRFKHWLGRTPHSEIRRVQLERAKHLLRETSLPLSTIAHRSGFPSVNYFSEVFHGATGSTPGVFRRKGIR